MRLLVDMNLSPRWQVLLASVGIEAITSNSRRQADVLVAQENDPHAMVGNQCFCQV
jgi:predicted nuclease of predicted toxin-antitoxin system